MKQNSDKAYEKKHLMRLFLKEMEEKMKQLEKEITETDRKKSTERLKSYEKAIADILADVKKNKNKESGEE